MGRSINEYAPCRVEEEAPCAREAFGGHPGFPFSLFVYLLDLHVTRWDWVQVFSIGESPKEP